MMTTYIANDIDYAMLTFANTTFKQIYLNNDS